MVTVTWKMVATWFEERLFLFVSAGGGGCVLVGAVSLLFEADVDVGEAGVAMHHAVVVVRLAVGPADGDEVVGTRGHAHARRLAVTVQLALAPRTAHHHTAFI